MYPNDIGTASNPVPHDSMLSQIEAELSNLRERLAQSTGELGSIADRCFGTQPQPVPNKGQGSPIGSGLLARVSAEIEALSSEIMAIEERTKRLCSL